MPPERYHHDLEVQYRDLDPRSHVNHARYVSYLEQAKGEFFRDVLGTSLAAANTAVRHLELDYRSPIEYDRSVTVALGPIDPGDTSYTIAYEITDGETVVATAETVSVLLDDNDRPRSLPESWREAIESYESVE
ncbi:acyl-CoA thioesterase [Halobacteriales archaeon Cl-PHB]